jgi:hypothetical protein
MLQPAECPRTPAADVQPVNVAESLRTPFLRDASRLIGVAYPGLSLYYDARRNKIYVVDGQAYEAIVKFERDERSGHAVLALSYMSRHDAALLAGERLTGGGCRSAIEVVVARMGETGAPSIVSRALVDDEALAIDVRTLQIGRDFDGDLRVQLFYHAYYGASGWFGYVTYRSDVIVAGSRLVTYRMPAGYVRVSNPGPRQQQGAIGPAGQRRPGFVALTAASFDKGTYEDFEVPIVGAGSLSGVEVLRRIP